MSKCRYSLPPAGRRRWMRRDESGAAAVEFALVILPLVFILYGLIAFGMMFALKQSMTNAAADAARSAIGAADPVAAATATVADRLDWLDGKYVAATDLSVPAPSACANDPSHQCITVTINYPYKDRPLVPAAPGLGLITPDRFQTQATVQIS